MHLQVVVLCTLTYSTVAMQHKEFTNEDLMELKAYRKDGKRQEKEVLKNQRDSQHRKCKEIFFI